MAETVRVELVSFESVLACCMRGSNTWESCSRHHGHGRDSYRRIDAPMHDIKLTRISFGYEPGMKI